MKCLNVLEMQRRVNKDFMLQIMTSASTKYISLFGNSNEMLILCSQWWVRARTYLSIVLKPSHEIQKCIVRARRVFFDEEGGESQLQQLPVLIHKTNECLKCLLGIFSFGSFAQTHVETDRGLVV